MGGKISELDKLVWERFIKTAMQADGFIVREVPAYQTTDTSEDVPKTLQVIQPLEIQIGILTKGARMTQNIWWELYVNHRGLHYDDVEGQPNKSNRSRLTADISSRLVGDIYLPIPVVSANMECVTDGEFAKYLARRGAVGVVHQFFTKDQQVAEVMKVKQASVEKPIQIDERLTLEQTLDANGKYVVGAAIGVNDGAYRRAHGLIKAGVDFLVVDIAHGHSKEVIDLVKKIKRYNPGTKVIAGNVVTPEAAYELCEAGVDGLKVGIGPGDVCITGDVTGFGSYESQLTAIARVKAVAKNYNVTVIADGGIKNSGHVAQALAAGANTVMIGSMFAACEESANFNSEDRIPEGEMRKNRKHVLYWGSASSRMNRLLGLGSSNIAEGTIKELQIQQGGAQQVLLDMRVGLGSAFSYAGAKNTREFYGKSRWNLAK